MTTIIEVDGIAPLTRSDAMRLAETEYRRFEESLHALTPEEWSAPTPDCPRWNVQQMVAHVLAGCEACLSFREMIHQMRGAKRVLKDPAWDDPETHSKMHAMNNAMNEFQIRERADLTPDALRRRFAETHPRALTARARKPRALNLIKMKDPNGVTMAFGDLYKIIYTRDTWMHRADIARATGREMSLSAQHDGRIVSDAVSQWASRHGKPFTLDLTGDAGGTYTRGTDGEKFVLDAVDFCRITSGRGEGWSLLQVSVPW